MTSDHDFKGELAQLADGGPDPDEVRATVWSSIHARHRSRRRAGVVLAVAAVVAICAAVVLWPRPAVSPAGAPDGSEAVSTTISWSESETVDANDVSPSPASMGSISELPSSASIAVTSTDEVPTSSPLGVAGVETLAPEATATAEGAPLRTSIHDPAETLTAALNMYEGGVAGVGAPITITFSGVVVDKAAAQSVLTVSTSRGAVEGSWGWLPDEDIDGDGVLNSQVHYRTQDFWPAYTDVTVRANLADVNLGDKWGYEDLLVHFAIGRDLRVEADVASFRLKVTVDGVLTNDFPVSYGKTVDPARQTRNGTHIVQEHYPTFDLCYTQFGYCGVLVKWAVRINNNGEMIHENNSTIPYQGVANVSHGCVNMSEENAKIFYDMSLYGDPVTVSNSEGPPLGPEDFNYDWSYSYEQWQELSAL